ncbi:hypothetical protein [Natrialbaceae archaeon AArc-T1-2]|nr:hypothetical protein [Natrialbaceae archaeon AArc-T1-2]WIV67628.1 hypothetical protein QQ977_02540 [Natrialbaceae archaeon AArc-T1-2]
MTVDLSEFDHPAWTAIGGTVVGYLLILVVLTVVLFLVPWLLFAML